MEYNLFVFGGVVGAAQIRFYDPEWMGKRTMWLTPDMKPMSSLIDGVSDLNLFNYKRLTKSPVATLEEVQDLLHLQHFQEMTKIARRVGKCSRIGGSGMRVHQT